MTNPRNINLVWISRTLIGGVLFINLQCAVIFLYSPDSFLSAFGLMGFSGVTVIRGFGTLFLMWIIPSIFAFLHPTRHIISLGEANIMQFIGLAGESLLLYSSPVGDLPIKYTLSRFIVFDFVGLVLLITALYLSLKFKKQSGAFRE